EGSERARAGGGAEVPRDPADEPAGHVRAPLRNTAARAGGTAAGARAVRGAAAGGARLGRGAGMTANVTLVEAINLALAHELGADEDVVVLGQDVGRDGGVFRATLGLLDRFGPERVIDTPLAEGMIAGMAIGMAAQGLKPVAEIQFSGFAYTCIDQILNHAGRMRYRTRGRMTCPMVMRT